MNLDDLNVVQAIDTGGMLAEIDALPGQLSSAWQLAESLPLPQGSFSRVVLSGMGTAGLAAELLAAYAAAECPLPVFVQHDYNLPRWAARPETLVVCLAHALDDEETLSVFEEARTRGCALLVICASRQLADKAKTAGIPLWRFEHAGQPCAALGFFFGLLLGLFSRLNLLPDQAAEVKGALQAMLDQQKSLVMPVPAALNPAKRYAGQFVGRWGTIYGSGLLAPVARRWKCQINELAKAPANCEPLPEADHNALAGILNPASEVLMPHTLTIFLASPADHPRNRLRSLITRQTYMLEGLNTDVYMAAGDSPLARMWTAIHFGDYLAFYLAIAYAADPSLLEPLSALQATLNAGK